jgi:hypothetical protein
MSCCGQRRAQQRNVPRAFVHHQLTAPRASAGKFPMGRAYFEYVGETAITAVGSVTGRQYRFATPGVPVVVDARDRWSLARVPLLREVS